MLYGKNNDYYDICQILVSWIHDLCLISDERVWTLEFINHELCEIEAIAW